MPAKKAAKQVTETAKKAPAKKTAKKAAVKKVPAVKTEGPATKKAPAPKKSLSAKPTVEAIARAAYLNYLHRVANGLPGDAQSDWSQAERELCGV